MDEIEPNSSFFSRRDILVQQVNETSPQTCGRFWKESEFIKQWNLKNYYILDEQILKWSVPDTKEVTGKMNSNRISIVENEQNRVKSKLIRSKIGLRIYSLGPYDEALQDIEVVFETFEEAKKFLFGLYKASDHNNVREFFLENKWDMQLFHEFVPRLIGKITFN